MMDSSTINSLGGYPLGAANDPNAPYNQKDPEKVKVKVCVSVTYSQLLEVEVEEGYTEVELKEAVQEAKVLPNDILADEHRRLRKFIKTREKSNDPEYKKYLKKMITKRDKCKPWHEDELEVIECGNNSQQLLWQ